jgi:anti-sigma-K factor RskA
MNHEPFDTLAATYALGALDGDERVEFERHLAGGCDVC